MYSYIKFQISDRAQTKFFSFMNPLAIEIWFYIAFGYILVSICIWIVARLSPVEWVHSKPACSMACDHMLNKIRKAHEFQDQLELSRFRDNNHDISPYNNDHDDNDIDAAGLNEYATNHNDDHDNINKDNAYDGNESEDSLELVSVQNDFTLKNSFWFAIGALMQQGADLYPRVI